MAAELPDVDRTVERIEVLLAGLGESDPQSREMADEVIRLLMELYGAGLAKAMELLRADGRADLGLRLADDRLVGSLLLLHGLHPLDAESRVRRALARVARGLDSHTLALSGMEEGIARIQVEADGPRRAPRSKPDRRTAPSVGPIAG